MPSSGAAVLVAGLAGQLSAAVAGALPWWLLPVSALLLVLATRASALATDGAAGLLRGAGSVLALALVLLTLPHFLSSPDPAGAKGSLGLLLVGIQVAQALGWRSSRDLRTGLGVAAGLLVLGASYAPDVLVGAPLLVGWVAVLLALGRLAGASLRSVLPAAAVAVVLALVAFLLVPAPVSAGVRSRLAGGGAAPTGSRATQGTAAFSGSQLDLGLRGALGDDPVLTVDAQSPALWRATTFDRYDGRRWTRPADGLVRDSGPTYQVAAADRPVRTDTAVLATATDGTVWSPGRLVSVTAPGTRLALRNELGDVQLPGLTGSYVVTSEVPESDPALLRSRRGTDATEPRWRELPVDLPARVTELAQQITAGATNRWDAAEAVAAWLRTHATYRLDSPVPGRGEDAVDRFLFVDRTGFCEQFASAEVVLLRALGVPARLVTGLAYGEQRDGARMYRLRDLHAWVELWVPGVGWVASDPTAGVPLATSAGTGLRARVAAALTGGLRALTRVPGGRPVLAVLLLAATALVALVLARLPRRRRPPVGTRPGAARGPALEAFLRLDARLGERARRPEESLRELAGRLGPDLAPALAVVEQECYGAVPPDARAAVEVLDRY